MGDHAQTNINANVIKDVKNLYEDITAQVKIRDTLSENIPITKGLKQGCCLSTMLFKIYLQQALKKLMNSCKGIEIPIADENTLYTLFFADDQIILAQDHDDLDIWRESWWRSTKYGVWRLTLRRPKI